MYGNVFTGNLTFLFETVYKYSKLINTLKEELKLAIYTTK